MTYILGLTGSIATGKSTVSRYFSDKGIPLVDADLVARKVVEPETKGLAAITKTFGNTYLLPDGRLNRKKLGTLIFSDDNKRQELNELLQAYISNEIDREIAMLKQACPDLIVLDIPLLFENNYTNRCDAVMVVYTTPEVQMERLMARNQLSTQEAKKRIASQMSIEEKRKRADFIINNNDSRSETYKQVEDWLEAHKNSL